MRTINRSAPYVITLGALASPAPAFALPIVARNMDALSTNVLCPIVDYIFTISMIFGIAMILVAGYKYMTSGGEPNKVGEARKSLTYGAVGILVALLAGSVPRLIATFLNASYTFVCG